MRRATHINSRMLQTNPGYRLLCLIHGARNEKHTPNVSCRQQFILAIRQVFAHSLAPKRQMADNSSSQQQIPRAWRCTSNLEGKEVAAPPWIAHHAIFPPRAISSIVIKVGAGQAPMGSRWTAGVPGQHWCYHVWNKTEKSDNILQSLGCTKVVYNRAALCLVSFLPFQSRLTFFEEENKNQKNGSNIHRERETALKIKSNTDNNKKPS